MSHQVTISGGGLKQAIQVQIESTPQQSPSSPLLEALMRKMVTQPKDRMGIPLTRSATEGTAG